MLSTLIRNEILKNIKSEVFTILFIIVFIITTVGIISLVINYNSNLKNYKDYVIQHKMIIDKITSRDQVPDDIFYPIQPAPKLSLFFLGIKQFIGKPAIDRNPVPYLFTQTDFGLIIGILMSLLAILLSYNAISGEKEDAMLRVVLSNPVKRGTLIGAKWIGGIISLIIPLLVCYVISLLIIIIFAHVSFSGADWASILIFFIISLFYISSFYLIGLYISTKTKQAYISLLTCILIWGLCILVLPTFPDYIGKLVSRAPNGTQLVYTQIALSSEADKKVEKVKNDYRQKGYKENVIDSIADPEIKKIYADRDAQLNKFGKYFDSKMGTQVFVATSVCFLSPYSAYILGGNEICATGISSQILFNKQANEFRDNCYKYADGRVNDLNKKFSLVGCPNFEYKEVPFTIRILAAGLPILFLIIYNIIFFVMSFKAFNRYDLR